MKNKLALNLQPCPSSAPGSPGSCGSPVQQQSDQQVSNTSSVNWYILGGIILIGYFFIIRK